jgi:hypothetical protein
VLLCLHASSFTALSARHDKVPVRSRGFLSLAINNSGDDPLHLSVAGLSVSGSDSARSHSGPTSSAFSLAFVRLSRIRFETALLRRRLYAIRRYAAPESPVRRSARVRSVPVLIFHPPIHGVCAWVLCRPICRKSLVTARGRLRGPRRY